MGAIAHLFFGSVYTAAFIVAWRSLKSGDLEYAARAGLIGALGLGADLGLYALGVGLFS